MLKSETGRRMNEESKHKVSGRRTGSNRKVKFKRRQQMWLRTYESLSDTAENRKEQCSRKWKFKGIHQIWLKANDKLKENFRRRRKYTRMIRLQNRGNLIEETRGTEATSTGVTEEKHGSDSNEPRTASSTCEIKLADVEVTACVRLEGRCEDSHKREVVIATKRERDSTIPAQNSEYIASRVECSRKKRVTSPLARRVTSVL
jgi:hypothetical protein